MTTWLVAAAATGAAIRAVATPARVIRSVAAILTVGTNGAPSCVTMNAHGIAMTLMNSITVILAAGARGNAGLAVASKSAISEQLNCSGREYGL